MKKFMVSAVSLAALAASGIAYADNASTTTQQPAVTTDTQNAQQPAQTQPDTSGTQSGTTAQQQPSVDPNATTAQQPSADTNATTAQQPSADTNATTAQQPSADTNATTAEQPAQSPGKPIAVSDIDPAKSTMASSWIGSSVYSAANENVGDINDIILSSDGNVKAVVLGVGGFLGMGEKDVAVPMSQLAMSKDENGSVKLTINATRADLEATPAFDRTHFTVGTVQQ